ncbi:hypothetical protein DFH09DRAFT_1088909 [Mycena vulgaris]|nr:hypothetical protein DFH09DRAFT_1088909 [Mycena vulgaris]
MVGYTCCESENAVKSEFSIELYLAKGTACDATKKKNHHGVRVGPLLNQRTRINYKKVRNLGIAEIPSSMRFRQAASHRHIRTCPKPAEGRKKIKVYLSGHWIPYHHNSLPVLLSSQQSNITPRKPWDAKKAHQMKAAREGPQGGQLHVIEFGSRQYKSYRCVFDRDA